MTLNTISQGYKYSSEDFIIKIFKEDTAEDL